MKASSKSPDVKETHLLNYNSVWESYEAFVKQ